jgi:peroxiredoxin
MVFSLRSLSLSLISAASFALAAGGCSMIQGGAAITHEDGSLQDILETSFPSSNGPSTSLVDYRGNVIMLHFFASWCRDCAAEMASLKNLDASFDGALFEIVAIATDDTPEDAAAFTARHGLKFPVLVDTKGELKHYFSVSDLPTTIFLDKNGTPIRFRDPQTGRITAKIEGTRRWDTETPTHMIAGLVEAK